MNDYTNKNIELIKTIVHTIDNTTNNHIDYSTKWLGSKIKSPDSSFYPIQYNQMKLGKFYWIVYNTDVKNKMINYSPIYTISSFKTNVGMVIRAISLNFLPLKIRQSFFINLFQSASKILEKENKQDSIKEIPLNIDYNKIYSDLKAINYEWAIREFAINKIKICYEISQSSIGEFICHDSRSYTGVGEKEIEKIWISKLHKQKEREKEIIQRHMKSGLTDKELFKEYQKLNPEIPSNEQLDNFKKILKSLLL